MMALKSVLRVSALSVIVALLVIHNLYAVASAASGGRMGGSSFSSDKSSSSSSSWHEDDYHQHHHHHHHHHHLHHDHYRHDCSTNDDQNKDSSASFIVLTIFGGVASYLVYLGISDGRTSVLQIQVGLSAKAHSLQKELTKIALTTDTSTENGWNIILKETISSLLDHPDYYLYGYSSVTGHWTTGGAEQRFKQLSKEEQQKFDVQSLVKINNFERQSLIVPKADQVNKDCIVVTILVAAQGAHNLPTIETHEDVKEALQSLGEINSSKLKGVEVLWTPQDETDSLSVEELLENYQHLRRI